jgi:hypothetical protein
VTGDWCSLVAYRISLILLHRARENQSERLGRVNALVELLLQRALGFRRQIAFCRFLAGQLGQDRQFALQIVCRNPIPKAIFKREDLHRILLNAEKLSVWKLDDDFIRPDIDGQVMAQIETGFDRERAVQLYALRASRPGMQQLVFDFHPAGENDEFARGRGLFQVNAIVDRDARLQMRDVDESRAHVPAQFLQPSGALGGRSRGPALYTQENEHRGRGDDKHDQRQRRGPGDSCRVRHGMMKHE